MAEITALPTDRPTPLVEIEIAGGEVRSLDPIWPDSFELAAAEHAEVLLAHGSPAEATLHERAHARGLVVTEALLEDATRTPLPAAPETPEDRPNTPPSREWMLPAAEAVCFGEMKMQLSNGA